jgi:hypothetical protein
MPLLSQLVHVAAKQLDNGLDEQLEKFVQEHYGTRLIIVDTLHKVRKVGGEAYGSLRKPLANYDKK